MPSSSLIGFKRIKIMPNEEKVVDFIITPQMLQMVDWDGGKVILKGDYKLVVSTSAPCEKTLELGGILLKYDFVLN
jgi:beta-glucosidase